MYLSKLTPKIILRRIFRMLPTSAQNLIRPLAQLLIEVLKQRSFKKGFFITINAKNDLRLLKSEFSATYKQLSLTQKIGVYRKIVENPVSIPKDFMNLATFLSQNGELRQSVKILMKAIKRFNVAIDLHERASIFLRELNHRKLSELILKRLQLLYRHNPKQYKVSAENLLVQHRTREALALIEKALSFNVKSLEIVLNYKRLYCLLVLNESEKIVFESEDLLRRFPGEAMFYNLIIQAHIRIGRMEEASSLLNQAFEAKIVDTRLMRLDKVLHKDKSIKSLTDLESSYIEKPKKIIQFSHSILHSGNYDEALEFMKKHSENVPKSSLLLLESEIALYNEDYKKCRELCEKIIELEPGHSGALFRKSVACAYLEDLVEAKTSIEQAFNIRPGAKNNFNYAAFQVYAANADYENCFKMYHLRKITPILNVLYPDRHNALKIRDHQNKNILILAEGGPGDELRFTCLYQQLADHFTNFKVFMTCEPRLLHVMERSFPEFTFLPVQRFRMEQPFNVYNGRELIGQRDLADIMDNNAYEIVQKDGFIFSVLELIPYLRPNRISFPKGTRHLIVNEQDQTFWSKKLQEATKRNVKVGISWRSGLLSQARNHHYLFIEEMKPLFEVKNVSFVNLQYNVADSEISFLTNYLGQRFLNFSELDLKNDFDGSNALMSNLDLVISPCTTTAEAAAACGVKTWMFSNSPLNNYRRQSATDCHDIWQPTLEIIRPKKFGDKEGLVNELALRLSQFYNEFTN